jgi:MFS family permease
MQHAVLAARTIVTAQSPEDERAALLGYIGASYGLGFALGPAAGGMLSSVSLQATAWAAAAGSLLALGIVAVMLPAGEVVAACICEQTDLRYALVNFKPLDWTTAAAKIHVG